MLGRIPTPKTPRAVPSLSYPPPSRGLTRAGRAPAPVPTCGRNYPSVLTIASSTAPVKRCAHCTETWKSVKTQQILSLTPFKKCWERERLEKGSVSQQT